MAVISELTVSQSDGTAQLIENIVGNGAITFNYASGRISTEEITTEESYDLGDYREHLSQLQNWQRELARALHPPEGLLEDHQYEAEKEIALGEVKLKMVIGEAEVNLSYTYSTDAVTAQPRVALDMSWSTFQEYTDMLMRFSKAIARLKSVKEQ